MTRNPPDKPDFYLSVVGLGGGTSISVTGEIDLATAAELAAAVREHAPTAPVTVDLGAVTFMDSSGIHVIDTLLRDADREHWSITFRPGLHDSVRQVLKMTGMLAVLPMADESSSAEQA